MAVLRYSPATQSFAPGVNCSWVFQLRLRGRSEVPIDERTAKVIRVVAGNYCQVASLDLAVVREVQSQWVVVSSDLPRRILLPRRVQRTHSCAQQGGWHCHDQPT
jgi:hypothetical protein